MNFAGYSGNLNIRRVVVLFVIQAVFVALSLPLRSLLDIQLPITPLTLFLLPLFVLPYGLGLASVLMLPILQAYYARILFDVAHSANDGMYAEQQRNTFTLLRTTPQSLREILLSQIAGSIWRQVENVDIILFGAAAFSLPPIALNYLTIWPTGNPLGLRFGIIIALAVSLLRLLLEPLMAGALGTLGGMTASFRTAGTILSAIMLGLYFFFLNAPRMLDLSTDMRILVEIVLPLLLPVLITWLVLIITEKLICRD